MRYDEQRLVWTRTSLTTTASASVTLPNIIIVPGPFSKVFGPDFGL
jgi:hypothetical protein